MLASTLNAMMDIVFTHLTEIQANNTPHLLDGMYCKNKNKKKNKVRFWCIILKFLHKMQTDLRKMQILIMRSSLGTV